MSNHNQIVRKIGVVTATSIVIANMVGAGIFTTTGLVAAGLPNPFWVLAFWMGGGLIALSGALCYAELATRMPEDGGEYLYLSKLYHPSMGFLSGWTSFFVGFSAPIAASALGFSEYILSGAVVDDPSVLIWYKKLLGIGIIAVFTTLHYFGLKWGSRIQNILTAIKIIVVLGLAVLGMLIADAGNIHLFESVNGPAGGLAIGTAMMFVMFSYSGWNASGYIAGEIKNPRKSLPLSLVLGTAIVLVIYLAVNLFILQSLPFEEVRGSITIVEKAAIASFGEGIGRSFGLLSGIALLASLSAFILLGPRIYYAMAKDRAFFSFAAKVHPRFGVPGRSIMVQGAIALILILIGSFEQIVIFLEFALLIFPPFAVAGLYFARRNKIGEDRAVKTWGYPIVPLFFIMASLGIMVVAFMNRPFESFAAIAIILLGIPLYYFMTGKWKVRFFHRDR